MEIYPYNFSIIQTMKMFKNVLFPIFYEIASNSFEFLNYQ